MSFSVVAFLALSAMVTAKFRPPEAAHAPTEYEVKAAFLYHFAQLVTWPAGETPRDGFVIGIVGPDPFGPTIDAAVRGKSVQSRPIVVRRFPDGDGVTGTVDLLFLSRQAPGVDRLLTSLEGRPVLTVGDEAEFASRGAQVGFRITPEGRVAFDISVGQMERAGLRMSSQVLKLARIVGPRPGQE